MMRLVKSIVELSHDYLKQCVKPGDIVVDATAGNGNDTLLLRELVGEAGSVYAFDIQEIAVERTKALLLQHNMAKGVTLFCENYKEIRNLVPNGIDLILFNLGYLPNGDHGVLSSPEDTVAAMAAGAEGLKSGGKLLTAVYWGHENGAKEKEAIEAMVTLPQYKAWGMYKISVPNREKAPFLMIMEKP